MMVDLTETLTVILRLFLAALMGGLVGLERESVNRPAGLRTHVLVCVGSALVMMVSMDMFNIYRGVADADPGRIAAQVVSGIGFLGAGTIMREGVNIRGLTTAASLWVVAGVGLAVGAGFYVPAVTTVLIVLCTLVLLSRFEGLLLGRRHFRCISLSVADKPGQLGKIGAALGSLDVNIKNISIRSDPGLQRLEIELFIRMPGGLTMDEVIRELASIEGVYGIHGS